MTYRRRASPLHAARAGAGALYCLALAACALVFVHPVVLAAVAIAVVGAGLGAGVGADLARAAKFSVPLALLVAVVNALVVRSGLTVLVRLGELPPFGQIDITLEALAYGLLLGARVVVIILCFTLFSAAVDPDELLALMRRMSFRSALTAALATRLVPVLARDARRMADARACRPPGAEGSRFLVARAVATSALDRAIDVAATLEVRGYGRAAARGGRGRPWSRHDLAFGASSLALIILAVAARAAGIAGFSADPTLHAPTGTAELLLAAAVIVIALLPFADRRGIER